VKVSNIGNLTESSTVEVWSKQYWAGLDGTLQYGESIDTKEFSITDRTKNGYPLFYKAYPRFYHLDYNKYIDGSTYSANSIIVKNKNGETYPYAYRIVLEVPTKYATATGSQIAYKVRVETESDEPFIVSYDRCDINMGNTSDSFEETLYPYPIFSKENSLSSVYPSGIDTYYVEDWAIGDMGYRVHVNSQAIVDHRAYQYFQWRVVGKASPVVVPPSSVYIIPDVTGSIAPTATVTGHVVTTGDKKVTQGTYVKRVRAAVVTEHSYNDGRGTLMNLVKLYCNRAKPTFTMYNPLAPTGSKYDSLEYWGMTIDQLKALGTSGLANTYDVLFFAQDTRQIGYTHFLDKWSCLPNKGIIVLLTPGSSMQRDWIVDLEPVTGTLATGTQTIVTSTGPLVDRGFAKTDFSHKTHANPTNQTLHTIVSTGVRHHVNVLDLVVTTGGTRKSVAAIIDSNKYVSTIGEHNLIVGRISSGGTPATGVNGLGDPLWKYDVDASGNFDYTKYTQSGAHITQIESLDRIVSAVDYLTDSATSPAESNTSTINNTSTLIAASTIVEYSTPWVDSWIISSDSLSNSEVASDPTLINDLGTLKRRLSPISISDYATRFFYESHGQAYKDWVVSDCEIEINNSNVHLVDGMNDNSIPWVYTDVYGGKPFVESTGYPDGYRLYEPGFNRPYERDEVQVQGWVRREHEETITNPHGIHIPGQWVDPEKIWHDAIVTTNPTTTTEVARTGAWKIGWTNSAAQSTIKWKASGSAETEGQEQTVSIANQTYIDSFSCSSLDEEDNANTAFAWQYLPNGNGILKQGSNGAKVSYWQDLLQKLGYYGGSIDGIYGPITHDAVYNFQVDHDEILDDGVIGPETASRITFAAGTQASEWYGWVSTWNMLPGRTGVFGRRTNPYDEIYNHEELDDYVCITLKDAQKVKSIQILGAMLDNQAAQIDRITAWNGATRVVDKQEGWTLKNSVTSIDIGSIEVDKIYVHIYQDSPFVTINTDGGTFPGYHWGIDYIDILVSSGTASTKSDISTNGTLEMYPGDSSVVSLPSGANGSTSYWKSVTITQGNASVSFTAGSFSATITCSGDAGSTTWGAESTQLVKPSDGIIKKAISPPTIPTGSYETCNLILKTTQNCFSSVTVAFYDIVANAWQGTSVSKETYESNMSSLRVGIKGGETQTNGGGTTTIPGYWETTAEGYWTAESWVPTSEIRKWTTLDVDGPIADISSADPPLIKMAMKPYYLRFYNGRRHIRLLPPHDGLSSTDPWYPRITYAEWDQRTRLPLNYLNGWLSYYPGAALTAHYQIPEDEPYEERYRARVVGERAEIVGPYDVKLKRTPMFAGTTTSGMIEISLILDGTGVASSGIYSIDHLGIANLNVDLTSHTEILATYSWRKREREIRGLNLNPYPGHTMTVDSTVSTGQNIIGLPIYVYLLPQYCTYDGSIIIDSIESQPLNWTIDKRKFEFGTTLYEPLAFLVGTVSLSFPISYDQTIILDARKRGGGDINSSIEGLWDSSCFSEKTYIEAGVIVVEIKISEKTKEEDIRSSIEQYIAAGTLYKIRWV
jgi:hypothetical protein